VPAAAEEEVRRRLAARLIVRSMNEEKKKSVLAIARCETVYPQISNALHFGQVS